MEYVAFDYNEPTNQCWKEICQGVNMLRTIFLRYAVTNYFEAADIAVTCMQ